MLRAGQGHKNALSARDLKIRPRLKRDLDPRNNWSLVTGSSGLETHITHKLSSEHIPKATAAVDLRIQRTNL